MNDEPPKGIARRLKLITADLKRYMEKRIELTIVTVGEQYARWMAESIQKVAGIILMAGALIFLLVALAIFLGSLLNSDSLGYVLVSLPLLILGYLLFIGKPKQMNQKIKEEFEEELLQIFMPDDDKKDEEKPPLALKERPKNKVENDGRYPERNTERKKESFRSRTQ